MRALVQNVAGKYLAHSGEWTETVRDAVPFSSAKRAKQFCSDAHLEGVTIILVKAKDLSPLDENRTS